MLLEPLRREAVLQSYYSVADILGLVTNSLIQVPD